jgi:NADH pyrophosphatase NudC (nudix superfamily)
MELDPNIAVLAAVTCGIGYLMAVAGVHKSALEWKRRRRVCPSCGRELESRVCSACRTS